ncbi:Pyridoxamine 5'-phosphate oxidase family protein [Perilla frutescens var. hirtella]|uniref:Pyridoxamine 5'-phosphate oxidase family protein n=1 Tax=Perilla frutescens var. hirtella TaxID=608512 RepID=A0AAD4P7W5_PERFH|nr:Pyridoxamine 5'-phosphate oxidase family protein [Perilla frutescens var. hirtella]KAH6830244.1 Pyridoxamine 5'-phosphate oxidase family protein [Perilla frutescens var. hirtella]
MKIKGFIYCFVFAFSGLFQESVQGRPLLTSAPRPRRDETATFARWLVSQSSWGVLNTISDDWEGAPFGNVVSFSDGLPDKGKGIPYFYLTTLDPTARNALKDQRSSFTLSEHNLGTCGKADPEDPSCAKITIVGKLKLLEGTPDEVEFARTALFTKHPAMQSWPKNHNFQIFKLNIENIFMINWYGGPQPITVEQYLNAEMNEVAFLAHLTA